MSVISVSEKTLLGSNVLPSLVSLLSIFWFVSVGFVVVFGLGTGFDDSAFTVAPVVLLLVVVLLLFDAASSLLVAAVVFRLHAMSTVSLFTEVTFPVNGVLCTSSRLDVTAYTSKSRFAQTSSAVLLNSMFVDDCMITMSVTASSRQCDLFHTNPWLHWKLHAPVQLKVLGGWGMTAHGVHWVSSANVHWLLAYVPFGHGSVHGVQLVPLRR
jgi:hypothetical protein